MRKIIQQSPDSALIWHEEDDKVVIQETVDVSGVIDRVQRLRQAEAVRSTAFGDLMAAIPVAAIQQWAQQFGLQWQDVANDDKLLDRCIADYSKFKVKGGVF